MIKSQKEILSMWNKDAKLMVSISCITFNQEEHIKRALESFLSQESKFRYEILIADDASTDQTATIIKKFEMLYPKIIFPIYRKINTFRKGYQPHQANFERAKGQYLALCDGDDYWKHALKIELQLQAMIKYNSSVSFHGVEIQHSKLNYSFEKIPSSKIKEFSMNEIIFYGHKLYTSTVSTMIKTSIVRNLPDFYYNAPTEDHYLLILGSMNKKALFLPNVMAVYSIYSHNSWHSNPNLSEHHIKNLKIFFNFLIFLKFSKIKSSFFILIKICELFLKYLILKNDYLKKIIIKKNINYKLLKNIDNKVVDDFGREWEIFTQEKLTNKELEFLFNRYFKILDFSKIGKNSVGFDLGCGTGRWAKFIAKKVKHLHCIDPSEAIEVCRKNLSNLNNCSFHKAGVSALPIVDNSMDFGYSLGVLHHIPDPLQGLINCVEKLKPGAPFLLYIYYSFDNKPKWYFYIWKISDLIRIIISKLPYSFKKIFSFLIALFIYFPFAKFSKIFVFFKISIKNLPLSAYQNSSFYTMFTDSYDRFCTRLERRFSKQEITDMMLSSGLEDIVFSDGEPYWVAVAKKIKND